MSVKKNQIVPLKIESISSDGSGVGRYEGQAVFVPGTAVGDELNVRIVKDCKRYAFGIVQEWVSLSADHIPPDCPVCGPCGGCCFRHLRYEAELRAKQAIVADAFARLGGLDLPCLPILPSPEEARYRNKVQFPVQRTENGQIQAGFYAARSHRVIPCEDCRLQPVLLNQIAQRVCVLMEQLGIEPYNEEQHIGLVRHIFLRCGAHSGQVMLCLVVNGRSLPHQDQLCSALMQEFAALRTIVLNVNTQRTNVITGPETLTLTGPGFIQDTLCDVPVTLGPLSFYQVNTPGAEQLYGVAAQFAQLTGNEVLLDLYCGTGTIGLSMAQHCRQLIGVEIVAEAVTTARATAQAMGLTDARFLCADAGQAAAQLAAEGLRPDVIVLDPPRKGCSQETLEAVAQMAPQRVVMVSCNPSTAARDTRILETLGYRAQQVQPVDMFPRTHHVETVVQLSKLQNAEHKPLD